jgi:hypothetical protein
LRWPKSNTPASHFWFGLSAATDLIVGVFDFRFHFPVRAIFFLCLAALLVAVDIFLTLRRINAAIRREEQMAELASNANKKARRNLKTVVEALGAELKYDSTGYAKVLFKHGRYTYQMEYSHVYRWEHGPNGKELLNMIHTCYQQTNRVPPDEKIATALLQINRAPEYFENLCRKDNFYV